jgi:hypothetical protein
MSNQERRRKVLEAAARNISGRNQTEYVTVTRARQDGAHIEYYEEKVRRKPSKRRRSSD